MKVFRMALCALLLTGCASLGFDQPKTLKQGLISAESQYHAVIDATDSSLNAGMISADAAESVGRQADKADAILRDAKTAYQLACGAHDADPTKSDVCTDPTAQSKLALAVTALSGLQEYLRSQGAKK